ncbi:MAG: cell division protein FtsA, partial [Gammaproteobacteria bacterium]
GNMAQLEESALLVALDIGTSKVACLVAQALPEGGALELLGHAASASRGLKRGVVVNIESTYLAIERVIEQAELMAGCQIHSVYTSISGGHIRGMNSHGVVAVREEDISQLDIHQVIEAAQAIAIPADQRVLHVLPQEFLVDEQGGIRDPRGMSGVRLEAKVHVVTCAANAAQNVQKCVSRCGINVADLVLSPFASSGAVLDEDEKDLGVCLLDIGGGTTDMAIFIGGAIQHTVSFPIAGDQVTSDIAMALRTPISSAELLKLEAGSAQIDQVSADAVVDVPGVAERPNRRIARAALAEVIEARYRELFELVATELRRTGLMECLPGGLVLTGGAAQIQHVELLAERVFDLPVRLALPHGLSGPEDVTRNPAYATAIGLLMHGYNQQRIVAPGRRRPDRFRGMFQRVRRWVGK